MILRTHPAHVREAIDLAEATSASEAWKRTGLSRRSIVRWAEYRAEVGGGWPHPDDDAAWEADRAASEDRRRRGSRSSKVCRLRKMRGQPSPIVDATGTRRRIEALMRLGWTQEHIAARLGMSDAAVGHMRLIRRRVWKYNADKVKAVYEELCMTLGPSKQTRGYTRNRDWAPPLAWDDDTIDDPNAKPATTDDVADISHVDEAALWRRMDGDKTVPLNRAERVELISRCRDKGWSYKQIEAVTGVAKIERYIARREVA